LFKRELSCYDVKRGEILFSCNARLLFLLVGDGNGALPESVAEPPPDDLEVGHTASAGHLSADSLLRPVVLAHTGTWESAG